MLGKVEPQPEVAGEAGDPLSQTHQNEGFPSTFEARGRDFTLVELLWIERDSKSLSVSWYQVSIYLKYPRELVLF